MSPSNYHPIKNVSQGLLRVWKADIVCLVETKMAVISREVVQSLWGCIHVDWCYLGANGASGGILLMWDRRVVEKVEECIGRYTVACSLRNTGDNFVWAFGGVCTVLMMIGRGGLCGMS